MIGHRLGPYEIAGRLGKGGMGEVYRARDGRLDRHVALKVLPPEVARDPTRLERFARVVGVALTWLLMGLAYYLLFLPVGLFLRATGKLRLEKRPDAARPSYWRPATRRPPGLDAYRRQF